ncbi:MAG: redoxin domain-containing protein [Alteromonadaceae bacterium]|nr:redoxin domain-containing protein [Alteromonadaceae bacterium]
MGAKFSLNIVTIRKWAIEITLLIALVVAITLWQTRDMHATDGSVKIENTYMVSLEGATYPLLQDGRNTLVYFFAPWCSICALSIGSLESVDTTDIDIVVVALDYDSIEAVQAFVEEHQVASRVLLGTNELKESFQIKGYPSYYILDESAHVVAKSFGFNTGIGIKLKQWLATRS